MSKLDIERARFLVGLGAEPGGTADAAIGGRAEARRHPAGQAGSVEVGGATIAIKVRTSWLLRSRWCDTVRPFNPVCTPGMLVRI